MATALSLRNVLLSVPLLACAIDSNARAAIVVDSFEDTAQNFPIVAGGGTGSLQLVASYPHVLGGRGISLGAGLTGAPDLESLKVDIINLPGQSLLSYTSQAVDSGLLQITYETASSSNPPLPNFVEPLPLHLVIDPNTSLLRLSFIALDLPPGQTMGITAIVAAGIDGQQSSISLSTDVAALGGGNVDIPLNALAPSDYLNALSVVFSAPAGAAFQLDSISIIDVPEPMSGLFILIGAGALLTRRKGGQPA